MWVGVWMGMGRCIGVPWCVANSIKDKGFQCTEAMLILCISLADIKVHQTITMTDDVH